MEIVTPPKQTFMPELKRCEPAVRDSTIVMKQKTCRRLYFYTVVCGFRERKNAGYLAFGGAYHKFREVLESTYQQTGDQQKSAAAALGAAISYWKSHGSEPTIGTKFDFLTGQRLMASCEVAFKHWKIEKQMNKMEVIHGLVEGPAFITLPDGITKIGARFDQVIRWGPRLMSRDFKSTSKNAKWFERGMEPNDQFSRQLVILRELSGEMPFGVTAELLLNSKKEGPVIVPLTTGRSSEQLDNFVKDEMFLRAEIDKCREADQWPMEEKQCPYCPFRLVCRAPNERAAAAQLKSGFDQRVWDFGAADLNPVELDEGGTES